MKKRFQPFPLQVLPNAIREFIAESSRAIGCDSAFVALPVLSVLAACIGSRRVIRPKPTWAEYPIIWTIVIARSGTAKTAALDVAVEPLRKIQAEWLEEHRKALDEFRKQNALALKNKNSQSANPGVLQEPTARRIIVSDITVEALAIVIDQNPDGVLMVRDELSGWLRGFNQYKNGRGADVSHWLECHRGQPMDVDRKTGDRKTIHIPIAAVSVCGTIQPGIFDELMTPELRDSGLMARLLVAMPPVSAREWSAHAPTADTVSNYHSIVRRLVNLNCINGAPIELELEPAAVARWASWFDKHAQRVHQAGDDDRAAALSKLEAYALRFALVLQLAKDASSTAVDEESLVAGIALADWFADEMERVSSLQAEGEHVRELRVLHDWIERRGGSTTVREVMRHLRAYESSEMAEAALLGLVEAGLAVWEPVESGECGGRPTRCLRLVEGPSADETSASSEIEEDLSGDVGGFEGLPLPGAPE